jgi:hypothetical protein
MLLKYEGDKGVGAQLVTVCKPKDFAGFYIGLAGEGCGRYSVAAPGQTDVGQKCDAEPCKDLPLSWFIENGVPCGFFNSATKEEANIQIFRQHLFKHVLNGKEIICIPMGFKKHTEAGSYTSWYYAHDAVHGGSLMF